LIIKSKSKKFKVLNFFFHLFYFKTYYSTAEEAINSVKLGHNWAALIFGEYFADSLVERISAQPFYNIDDEVIKESTVKLYADMTSN
jgi:hypothetical protein